MARSYGTDNPVGHCALRGLLRSWWHRQSRLCSSRTFSAFSSWCASAQRAGPFIDLAVPRPPSRRFGYLFGSSETKLPDGGTIEARLTFSADEPFGPRLNRLEIEVSGSGAASFVRTIRGGELREHWRVYTTTMPPRSVAILGRLGPRAFFPVVQIRTSAYRKSSSRVKHRIRVFVEASRQLFYFLHRYLSRSDVVGPFRTPPGRRYAFGGFSAIRGGTSGEQAVNLLITEALLKPHGPRPLHDALSFWINHLKLAEALDVKGIAKRLNLFQVAVKGAGRGTRRISPMLASGFRKCCPCLFRGS